MNLELKTEFKYFLLVFALVLPVTWWINHTMDSQYTEAASKDLQSTVEANAKAAARSVDAQLQSWYGSLTASMPLFSATLSKEADAALGNYLAKSPDFFSLQLFHFKTNRKAIPKPFAKAFSESPADVKANEVKFKIWRENRTWLTDIIDDDRPLHVANLSQFVGQPVLSVAVKVPVKGRKDVIIVVASGWHTSLAAGLHHSDSSTSWVVNSEAKVVTASSTELVNAPPMKGDPLVSQALNSMDPSRKLLLGNGVAAYSRLKSLNGVVIAKVNTQALSSLTGSSLNRLTIMLAIGLFLSLLAALLIKKITEKELEPLALSVSAIQSGEYSSAIQLREGNIAQKIGTGLSELSEKLEQKSIDHKKSREANTEIGGHIRRAVIPASDVSKDFLAISGYHQPAVPCGGAFWGHRSLDRKADLLYLVDDDESGITAAFNTGMLAVSFEHWVTSIDPQHIRTNPDILMQKLIGFYTNRRPMSRGISALIAVIDLEHGVVRVINHGSLNASIISTSKTDGRQYAGYETVIPIASTHDRLKGTPTDCFVSESPIMPGDKVVFYTHSLHTSSNSNRDPWGMSALEQNLVKNSSHTAKLMKDEILSKAFTHYGQQPIVDDIAMIVCEISKKWSRSEISGATIASQPVETPDFTPQIPSETNAIPVPPVMQEPPTPIEVNRKAPPPPELPDISHIAVGEETDDEASAFGNMTFTESQMRFPGAAMIEPDPYPEAKNEETNPTTPPAPAPVQVTEEQMTQPEPHEIPGPPSEIIMDSESVEQLPETEFPPIPDHPDSGLPTNDLQDSARIEIDPEPVSLSFESESSEAEDAPQGGIELGELEFKPAIEFEPIELDGDSSSPGTIEPDFSLDSSENHESMTEESADVSAPVELEFDVAADGNGVFTLSGALPGTENLEQEDSSITSSYGSDFDIGDSQHEANDAFDLGIQELLANEESHQSHTESDSAKPGRKNRYKINLPS